MPQVRIPSIQDILKFLGSGALVTYLPFDVPVTPSGVEPETDGLEVPVPYRGVQLAHVYKEGMSLEWPQWAEPKLDGARILAIIQDGEVVVYTRNGNTYPNVSEFLKPAAEKVQNGVLDGELFLNSWGQTMSAMRGSKEKNLKALKKAKLHVFDFLTLSEYNGGGTNRPYVDRKATLRKKVRGVRQIKVVPHTIVDDSRAANRAYKKFLSEGYEGMMLKDPRGTYRIGARSKSWLKHKPIITLDVRITGFKPGTGKHEGRLGAFYIETLDGETTGKVGTGFTDVQREEYWAKRKRLLGKIVEIKVQDDGKVSKLRFPRFVHLRPDR